MYYGLPKLGIKIDGFACGVIGLTFLGGSYMAEAFRAGLQSVAKGQIDSAKSIGLKPTQIFRYVIFPQALAISIPAIGANCLFLIKESSVVSAIAVVELLFVTKDLIGMDYKTTSFVLTYHGLSDYFIARVYFNQLSRAQKSEGEPWNLIIYFKRVTSNV